ncbi:MAG: hypothetical protein KKF48_01465 [Nanoarchaeota archaeon]|nr:hypothetical protein [Nanoarchaeota archaeon]MBU1027690.1 hypothetical protein [Nanoarchaeota archaeon]
MKSNKNLLYGIIAITLVLFLPSFVNAFAISSAYYDENPMYVYPEQNKEAFLTLQNFAGDNEIIVRADINSGSEVVQITDREEEYLIPLGDKTIVNLKINIPKDAEIGTIYPVNVVFTEIAKNSAGGLGFGSSIAQKFDVIVTETGFVPQLAPEEKTSILEIILLIIGIAIAIGVIAFFYYKKKNKKPTNFK